MDSSYTSWQSILDLPEHTSTQIDIMLHQPHPAIFRPTLTVVVTHHIFIIGVRIFSEISFDQLPGLIFCKSKQNINMIHVAQIDSYRVLHLQLDTLEDHKFVLIERRTCDLVGSVQAHYQDINYHTVELVDEGGELETHQQTVEVCMVHIFEVHYYVVFGSHVVSYVMIHNQPKKSVKQSQIYLLKHFIQSRLHQHQRLLLGSIPHSVQIVDTLTIFIDQKRWRLGITWFNPVREQSSLIGFIPKILI